MNYRKYKALLQEAIESGSKTIEDFHMFLKNQI